MEFKEFLTKQGVTEEQANKIVSGMPENKFYLTNEEKLDERYAKLKQQKEDLQNDLNAANALVDNLKKSNKSNEELQQQVEDYKTQIESLNNQRAEDRKNNAIELALKDAKARNTKAVKSLLDLDKIEVTDEGIKGLNEQLESFRESDAYLFETEKDGNNSSGKQATFVGNASGGNSPADVTQQMINAFTADLSKTN
ncbi:phage scaffolding protein [Lactococcus lactis]|uniref:DNA repair exonuclease SbcCD ATPase subunit n=1 Tax=Lactococcus lactis TaxID=1358 RepID=A0AAW5TRI4_9LACT|nr:phage scaffolding protein [Lactococcus lactis]MCW2281413.1 DNA repair exonuclease SbcCD ATPase subunit [Lactococcus lactis]MCW2281447.1 DNA repair exonuclease SbcCD ATPase subunit [Lactococcus lactis]MCW2282181.1 DNA repair exonuclease SbcCD ATPase subunit [Lactococcus lactis]